MVGGTDRNGESDSLAGFGLESGDDGWLDRIREAERPLALGRIGHYELLHVASRGGQGVVYRARDVRSGRVVAVKRLTGGSFASFPSRRRFEREMETAVALDHPNIVSVFGVDTADGQPVLVMQWIDGSPIVDWAAPNEGDPPAQRDVLELFAKVCDAVQHAHQRGVIHRDLKPSNILVDAEGEPHLLDFGLAKLEPIDGGSASGITLTGQFLGTPAFASPEQVRGGPAAVDVRSDVYSLGVLLYRVLTGRMPYPVDGTLAEVFRSIELLVPRPASSIADVDRELDAVLAKAMEKDARRRYQSADALGAELRRYLRGDALEAQADRPLYVLGKTLRRHRVPVAIASAALIVLLGFAATMSVMYGRAEREAQRARQAQRFLQEMLGSVSPYRAGGGGGVTEMLSRAGARIETDLAGQPEAQAALRQSISQIYAGLWMWSEAEPHLRVALRQFEQLHRGDHPEVATCLTLLGRALSFQFDPEAISVQQRALAMRTRLHGERHPLVAETHGNLAFAVWHAGGPSRLDEAEHHYRRALTLYEASRAGPLDHRARTAYSFASFSQYRGRIEEALALYESAIGQYRVLSGSDDVYMNQCLEGYANCLQRAGRYDEAAAALDESIRLRPKGFADEQIADLRWRLARVHHLRGMHGMELDDYDESLALRFERLAADQRKGSSAMAAHAVRLRDHEHDAEYYADVLDALTVVEPARAIAGQMLDVASGIEAIRGHGAADVLVERAVATAATFDDAGDSATEAARARRMFGSRLIDLARYDIAEAQLLESYRRLQHLRGASCPYTRNALSEVVRLYERSGQREKLATYRALRKDT